MAWQVASKQHMLRDTKQCVNHEQSSPATCVGRQGKHAGGCHKLHHTACGERGGGVERRGRGGGEEAREAVGTRVRGTVRRRGRKGATLTERKGCMVEEAMRD
eukprot:3309899-Pleurochrysis_carterae.AAC.3